jgi:hypothetical protein
VQELQAHAHRRPYSASLSASEKEFSKKVLTGEQTVDDREFGGKMLPNLRNKAFPPCGHAEGGYVSLRVEYRMRQRAGASILNLIACIAAFALVALIVMFGHPAAPRDRAATVTADAASEVHANSALTPASASPAEYRAPK